MIRSLLIAALTFLGLGFYYQAAEEDVHERAAGESQSELTRIARSSALFGVNRMKEALAEKWVDQRAAGVYGGGRYRTVAVLKRGSGTVRSVGVAGMERGEMTRYAVRMSVYRRMRSLGDASSGFDVLTRAPSSDFADHDPFVFIESSRHED